MKIINFKVADKKATITRLAKALNWGVY